MNSSIRDGKQWAWDATSLTAAMTCPRKYYYQLIRGLRPKTTSVHLLFGGEYASSLERFYKLRAEGHPIEESTIIVVRECMCRTWTDAGPVPFGDDKKTRFSLIRSIIWYIDQFGDESQANITTVHLADGRPAVELSFSFELSEHLLLCGHLDRLVEFAGAAYVMDQKTSGSTIGPYFFEGFKMDNQMSLYTIAGQIILGSPVRGVIIDGAQIAVGFTRFERGFTYRTQGQLEEWIKSTKALIASIHDCAEADFYPLNTTACGRYNGCEFLPICSAPPHVREAVIASEYTQRVWDPLQRR